MNSILKRRQEKFWDTAQVRYQGKLDIYDDDTPCKTACEREREVKLND